MNRRSKLIINFAALASWGIASLALAQSAQPRGVPLTDSKAPSADQASPQVTFSAAMKKSGGSLAQASRAMGADAQQPSSYSYYAVPKAEPKSLKKHDLITIVVREESAFSSEGTSDLERHSDFDAQIDAYMQLHFNPMTLVAQTPTTPIETKLTHDRNFKGTATVDRTDTMTARITAEIVDVKPNGNLVLQATKKIKTDEEEQRFTLIGTCRAEDLGPDNTVLSTQLYSLELTKTHTGAVRDTTERGFLTRLLDSINPF